MTSGAVYKLLTEADWLEAEARGHAATALDRADGYVHLSAATQLGETARRHFAGRGRVRLLRFDAARLADLRWEPSRGGELFPHLYGALDIAKATSAWWLDPDTDGTFHLPEAIG